MSKSQLLHFRGKENALKRFHPADDPQVLAAVAARVMAHAEQAVRREAERLSIEQRTQLAILLLTAPDQELAS